MKYLITGGAGFIGSNITRRLLSLGNDVLVIDDLSAGVNNLENLKDRNLEFEEKDIRDTTVCNSIIKSWSPNIVIHAACRSVVRGEETPFSDIEVNARATLDLLLTCKNESVNKFVYCSSASVYGDLGEREVLSEKEVPNPSSHYAVSKLAGENYTNFYNQKGLSTISLRYFNVYGPFQNKDSIYGGVIPIFINSALENTPYTIYGDGLQTRDFTYIDDVVDATLLAADKNIQDQRFFNIGSGVATSINSLSEKIHKASKNTELVKNYKDRRLIDNVVHRRASIDLARKHLNYNPKIDLSSGIEKTVQHFRERIND